jgi:Flp pilus assembly protein TadG
MAVVRSRHRRRGDRGAAAVEFALVTPVLLVMLFGIIDYGIWFADSISARQAVRNAAREGSVGQFGACAGTVANPLENLACSVKSGMDQISGTTAVLVTVATDPTDRIGGATWTPGYTLRICAITKHSALMPLVPFPNQGLSFTRVDMPIEVAGVTGAVTYSDALPPGGSWSSCS